MSVEELDVKYKTLCQRRDVLQRDKDKIEAELEARKRALKAQMEAAVNDGFNPDTLKDDIKRNEEVLTLKLGNFEAELNGAEKIIKPMLEELK